MGHGEERDIAQDFRKAGYDFCRTTREVSRLLDGCGIDLENIPVALQIKAGIQKNLSIAAELKNIKDRLILKVPSDSPWHKKPKALLHSKPVGRGKQRTEYHKLVTMTYEDWLKLVVLAYPPEVKE